MEKFIDLEQKQENESNQDYIERVGWTIMFNTVAVADRIKNTKHKNRNGPRSKDKPDGRMQNEGRETGKETKQTTQV